MGDITKSFDIIHDAIVDSAEFVKTLEDDTYVEVYAREATEKIVDHLFNAGYVIVKSR